MLLPFASHLQAITQEPHELVASVVARVMARLGDAPDDGAASQTAMLQLFEEELSPRFAFRMISRWIAGRNWQSFSSSEREELMAAVREHVVHVYASLLSRGRSVEISIDRKSTILTKSAKVGGHMATPDGRDFKLEFRLLRSDDDWKLYDLSVDGLSFARSLQAELSPVIEAGGIDGLRSYLARFQ